jgi:hypothetical protein
MAITPRYAVSITKTIIDNPPMRELPSVLNANTKELVS